MSSSNCCFLTYIQISQEAVRWSDIPISENFPQFLVIHTVKGFGIVNKAEIDVFLEIENKAEIDVFFCFFSDVGNLFSGSSAFSAEDVPA